MCSNIFAKGSSLSNNDNMDPIWNDADVVYHYKKIDSDAMLGIPLYLTLAPVFLYKFMAFQPRIAKHHGKYLFTFQRIV